MKHKYLLLIAAAFSAGAFATTYTIDKVAVRAAQQVFRPISNDTVDTKGKKFGIEALLQQRFDRDFTRGSSTTVEMNSDSVFTFAKPAKGEAEYIMQRTQRGAECSA